MRAVVVLKGGAGSGHYGHKGRPGEQGGSLPADSSASKSDKIISDIDNFVKTISNRFGVTVPVTYVKEIEGAYDRTVVGRYNQMTNEVSLVIQKMSSDSNFEFGGAVDFGDNTYAIKTASTAIYGTKAIIVHELAHALDFGDNFKLNTLYSDSDEFEEIYKKFYSKLANLNVTYEDMSKAVSRYSLSSSREFFAESMVAYVFDPKWLQEAQPETYAYLSKLPVNNSVNKALSELKGAYELALADGTYAWVRKSNKAVVVLKGGPGSGHYGHKGIPGHQGGSLPKDNYSGVESAILEYTQLSDYSKSSLVSILDSDEMHSFVKKTQDGLRNLGIKSVLGSHRTQYLPVGVDSDVVGQVIEIKDIFSLSTGVGPKEYSGYLFDIRINVPVSKILASSKITPELFHIKSEEEFITKGMKLRLGEINFEEDIVRISATVVPDDTPLGGGVNKNDPEFWKYFSVKEDGMRVEKQLPISDKDIQKLLNLRVNIFYDKSDKLSEQVFTGDLTIGAWEEAMRAELRQLHSSAAAIAKGGWDQMTSADWGRLGTPLREQYKYLHGFATTIAEQSDTISLKAIQARARMYGRATSNTAALIQAGAIIESLLPWIPGDGSTNCLVNCRCRWDLKIIKVDKKSGDKTVRAVWRLSPAEHCETCIDRNGHVVTIVVPKDVNVPKYIGTGV